MKVVSVLNYKGGVGKTTVTANIGAGLAARGNNVLLIDLDPQSSLTYSFYGPDEAKYDLGPERTIKKWYDSPSRGKAVTRLSDLIVTPPRVHAALKGSGGQLDMIASHNDLVMVEALLGGAIDRKTGAVPPSRFVQVYRRLAEGLSHQSFTPYNYVLIDCPPNFQMMTRNAVVASDFLLIPSRPDYLSTTGIDHLGGAIQGMVRDYNNYVRHAGGLLKTAPPPARVSERILFTMVQNLGGGPMEAHNVAMNKVKALGAPLFTSVIRDRKAVYATAPEYGIPVALGHHVAAQELSELVDEFVHWTERNRS